jgi:glutamine amidotransferase
MGWNTINNLKPHPLFDGVKETVDFYFVHSYRCVPEADESVLAYCDYGLKFASAVAKKNVIGVQFHPEKSQDAGLRVLINFSKWDGSC